MYQAAVHSLLGLQRHGATMSLDPCIPAVWPRYTLEWKIGRTRYHFTVVNPEHRSRGIASADLDGVAVNANEIPLVDDGGEHEVRIVLGGTSSVEEEVPPRVGRVTSQRPAVASMPASGEDSGVPPIT